MWDSCKSEYFKMYNGVKQGGVISCLLFNLYIDLILVMGAISLVYMREHFHMLMI